MQYIYALQDPSNLKIRYIGKAVDPERRFRDHISSANLDRSKTRKNSWIKGLKSRGLLPRMIILDSVSEDLVDEAERVYIEFFQSKWLTNGTAGGTGGAVTDPEAKARIRQAHVGRKASEATKAKMSLAHKKRYEDPQEREKSRQIALENGSKPPIMVGSQNPRSILTDDLVASLRRRIKNGEKLVDVSQELQLSLQVLSQAATGVTWKHVQESPVPAKTKTKLSQDDKRKILELLNNGETQSSIAARFNISQPHVSKLSKSLNKRP